MAFVKVSYTTSQTNTVIVEATADKIILVTRIVVGGETVGNWRLLSDPGGAGATELTPKLWVQGFSSVDLRLGRRFGLPVERGKSLGVTTSFAVPPSNHSLAIWYELVD